MVRRIIRRRRPTGSRRVVVRRSAPAQAAVAASPPKPTEPTGSPILVATTNSVRNLILPKLATFEDVRLVGMANTPAIALKMIIQEHPEAVIIDIDFGEPFGGLDTAKLMQKTRNNAAIVMLVNDIDPVEYRSQARLFGASWSYMKKSTATRENILSVALKSAVRGVQWIEPELSRPLAELWKIALEARDLDAAQVDTVPPMTSSARKTMDNPDDRNFAPSSNDEPVAARLEENADDTGSQSYATGEEEEVAPGIKLKSTNEPEVEGIDLTSISVGRGGVGQDVGRIRRAR